MSNDFIPFAVGGSANVTPQATYAANTTLTQNGFVAGIAKSTDLNKVWRQSSIMSAVLAQFITNTTGQNSVDDGTTATLLSNLIAAVSAQSESVIGGVRNLAMSVVTASATATMTADEIIVGSALGGLKYTLASFSKTINLATTGAGGMDTGTAPVSGYVALYAIYNPTTGVSALLATNTTSAVAPNVYGGANMPSGYTASGLVAVVPTNASSQFPICYVRDRHVIIVRTVAYTATTNHSTMTAVSLSAVVPKNAVRVWGDSFYSSSVSADSLLWSVGADASQAGTTFFRAGASNGQYPYVSDMPTMQTVYITNTGVTGTITFNVNVTAYDF
jgi:hypothetical protein